MDDLIEALKMFKEKGDTHYPFHCEHDTLYMNTEYVADQFSEEELKRLEELGFMWHEGNRYFMSHRFGSC